MFKNYARFTLNTFKTVALVLCGVHLVNVWIVNELRKRRLTERYLQGRTAIP